MTPLALGFIPLTDCAPLAVAEAGGFFAAEGLAISLSREASWATVRDKVAIGALVGAHMLAPMTLAAATGLGPPPLLAPLALAVNGAGITLSNGLVEAMGQHDGTPRSTGAALARVIAARHAAGEPALTFAVVFPFSMHNYTLRYWLSDAGIDPNRDVRIVVVPPPRMVEQLRVGQVDGICVGAPWNAVAVNEGLGQTVLRTSRFWPGGPDKVFAAAAAFAGRDPDGLQRILRALVRAQAWCAAPHNRADLVALLSSPNYVAAEPAAIAMALEQELIFQPATASAPRLEHARWFLGQMRRWGQIGEGVDEAALAARVYRPDMALEALAACGVSDSAGAPAPLYDGSLVSA